MSSGDFWYVTSSLMTSLMNSMVGLTFSERQFSRMVMSRSERAPDSASHITGTDWTKVLSITTLLIDCSKKVKSGWVGMMINYQKISKIMHKRRDWYFFTLVRSFSTSYTALRAWVYVNMSPCLWFRETRTLPSLEKQIFFVSKLIERIITLSENVSLSRRLKDATSKQAWAHWC